MASINSVIRKLPDRGVILYWENMAVRRYCPTATSGAVNISEPRENCLFD
jgi:hypothetical protein